ncbi:MAG TPA: hypothetical protein VFP57_04855 [Sphingomicrobium sp.]|jgi:hypothetical protein|nr:hypothetical protein [Sphingomicrobium sp.]
MRVVLLVLIVAVIVVIVAVASGFLDINQIRGARAPQLSTTDNGVTAKGAQAPAFDVEAGSVKIGSKPADVKVPTLQVVPPQQNQPAPAIGNSQ